MSKQDYYDVLGVQRGVSEKELKSAYRKLALKYHPDQNAGDKSAEKKFKEVGEAYAILSDPEKRSAYDQMGHAAFQQGGSGGNPFRQGASSDIFEDLFSQVFGQNNPFHGGRRGPVRGDDVRYDMTITLEEAFAGKPANIKVPGMASCSNCNGSGTKPGTNPQRCTNCGGSGRVRQTQGIFQVEHTCGRCQGRGEIISNPCKICHGHGQVRKTRDISVNIPAGVDNEMRVRLPGEGEPGPNSGPRGDLYIFVKVERHELFERDGPNLYCSTYVPMTTAALGGKISVPTIDGGKVQVTVPEGADSGRKLRLRGKGMPALRSDGGSRGTGDLLVELKVETPKNLSLKQKKLLQELEEGTKPQFRTGGKSKNDKKTGQENSSEETKSDFDPKMYELSRKFQETAKKFWKNFKRKNS